MPLITSAVVMDCALTNLCDVTVLINVGTNQMKLLVQVYKITDYIVFSCLHYNHVKAKVVLFSLFGDQQNQFKAKLHFQNILFCLRFFFSRW